MVGELHSVSMLCFLKVFVGMPANVATTTDVPADQTNPQVLQRKEQRGDDEKVKNKSWAEFKQKSQLPPALHTRSTCSLQLVLGFDSTYIQDTWKQSTYSSIVTRVVRWSIVKQKNGCKGGRGTKTNTT